MTISRAIKWTGCNLALYISLGLLASKIWWLWNTVLVDMQDCEKLEKKAYARYEDKRQTGFLPKMALKVL